jgi:hypothetical protein
MPHRFRLITARPILWPLMGSVLLVLAACQPQRVLRGKPWTFAEVYTSDWHNAYAQTLEAQLDRVLEGQWPDPAQGGPPPTEEELAVLQTELEESIAAFRRDITKTVDDKHTLKFGFRSVTHIGEGGPEKMQWKHPDLRHKPPKKPDPLVVYPDQVIRIEEGYTPQEMYIKVLGPDSSTLIRYRLRR